MAIYRGPGGPGDATADASNASAIADGFADAANASAGQAAASAASALAAKVAAELAETNAETAETNAEAAEAAAVVAKDAAEAVLLDTGFSVVASDLQGSDTIGTVAADIVNVNSVATNMASILSVDANEANINIVAADGTDIGTVAASIADVNSVADNIADVTAVADNETNIDAVAANNANITTVAGISGNVTTVAGISANVTTVATNDTNVTTVATNIANVNSVATNIANVNAVAGNETNIDAVAANETNIDTVAGISANVTTVATNNANVTTVATNIASVNTNATNIANINQNAANIVAIQNASANATTATTQAGIATTQAAAASASAAAASAVALGNEPVRHSVRPSLLLDFANTKTLDPRITFTRASTGTFYDGKTVAKAEENLFVRSDELDNTTFWGRSDVGVTANAATAPDGTTTAESIVPNTTTAVHFIQSIPPNSVGAAGSVTFSVYVKPNGYTKFGIKDQSVTGAQAVFDCTSTGSVVATDAGSSSSLTATITAEANGYYRLRLSFAFTGTMGANTRLFVLDSAYTSGNLNTYTWTPNGTSGVFIWGAQAEARLQLTAYTATTTAPITNYIPALQTAASGVARFEHNPVTGESLGLEIEEQRTNLLTYSQDPSLIGVFWTNNPQTWSPFEMVAPDGSLARRWVGNASNTTRSAISFAVTAGASFTFSCYFKKGVGTTQSVSFANVIVPTARGATFNLDTGAITGIGVGITATATFVGNGWYRCTMSVASNGTGTGELWIFEDTTNTHYIWGAQLEAGAFATSYIPTTTAQVTRSADAASIGAANQGWLNLPDGTFYIESAGMADTAARLLSYGTAGLGNFALYRSSATQYTTGITGIADLITNVGYNAITNKVAVNFVGLQPNKLSVNGGGVGTTSSTTRQNVGSNPVFGIGYEIFDNGNQANTTIRKVAYYPKALTNAELQGLTTV